MKKGIYGAVFLLLCVAMVIFIGFPAQERLSETIKGPEVSFGELENSGPIVIGEEKECGHHPQYSDGCTFVGAGKVCKTTLQGWQKKSYCCDTEGSNGESGCDCHKEYKNTCDTANDCLACLLFGESRGTNPDCDDPSCWKGVLCSVWGRVGSPHYPDDPCSVAFHQQGNTTHFEAVKCICDSEQDNQGYCDCCDRNVNSTEQNVYDCIYQYLTTFDPSTCPNPSPTRFHSGGGDIPDGCTEVTFPGCTAFKFYHCSDTFEYNEKIVHLEEQLHEAMLEALGIYSEGKQDTTLSLE